MHGRATERGDVLLAARRHPGHDASIDRRCPEIVPSANAIRNCVKQFALDNNLEFFRSEYNSKAPLCAVKLHVPERVA